MNDLTCTVTMAFPRSENNTQTNSSHSMRVKTIAGMYNESIFPIPLKNKSPNMHSHQLIIYIDDGLKYFVR